MHYYMDIFIKKYNVLIHIELFVFVANELGMVIGDPQTPFKTLKSYNHAEITEYFRSRRGLNLIIVIIPDRTDTTYGEGIVF